MKHRFPLILLLLLPLLLVGQNSEKKEKPFSVKFSGLIKTDFIFDTRQTVNLRDGSLLFYPEPERLDAEGIDVNATPTFNILSIQTLGNMTATGPDVLNAKTSGFIEAEFFGNANPNINVFRLRHAYIKLNWTKTEVLMGQTWHPMYESNCIPEVISADAGLPFKVYARNPQLRVTQQVGRFRMLFTAMTQIDFASSGPEGVSSKYLRNSVLPELDFQLHYVFKDEAAGREIHIGAGVDYLMLTPLMATEVTLQKAYDTVINGLVFHHDAVKATYKTSTHSDAWTYGVFAKIRMPKFTTKVGGIYSGNGYALSLLGGYAVKSVTDAEKGFVDYANIRCLAFWANVANNGIKWQYALFAGYSKNLGASSDVSGPYYARGVNIDYLYRVAPRLSYTINKFRLALELEYTVAGYGKINGKAMVYDAKPIGNYRTLLSAYYFF